MLQNLFSYSINPLFMYFQMDRIIDSEIGPEPMDFVYNRRFVYEQEQIKSRPGYSDLVTGMLESFGPHLYRTEEDPLFCPILLITFIISVFIAVNRHYRESFFLHFAGKQVPCITAFALEHFQPGLLSKHQVLVSIELSKEHDLICDDYGLPPCLFHHKFFGSSHGYGIILAWFTKLNYYHQKFNLFACTTLQQKNLFRMDLSSPILGLSNEWPDPQRLEFYDPYRHVITTPSTSKCYYLKNSVFTACTQAEQQVWLMLATALQVRLAVGNQLDPIEKYRKTLPELGWQETNFTEAELLTKLGRFIQWDCQDYICL